MRKFSVIFFGFLIVIAGCSLVKQAGLDDTRERVEGLEAANRQLTIKVDTLSNRVNELESQCLAEPLSEPQSIQSIPSQSGMSIEDRIKKVCEEEGFPHADKLISLAKCESGLNPKARNHTRREDSWGLYQINRKAHRHVTVKQACDVEWSTRWAINRIVVKNKAGKIIGYAYSDWKVCRRRCGL